VRLVVLVALLSTVAAAARADWRVSPDGLMGGPAAWSDVADAADGAVTVGVACQAGAPHLYVEALFDGVPRTLIVTVDDRPFPVTLEGWLPPASAHGPASPDLVAALRGGRNAALETEGRAFRFGLRGSSKAIGTVVEDCDPSLAPRAAAVPAAVERYVAATYGEAFETYVFEGDFTGDGRPDAITFAYFPMGGNSFGIDVSLFEGTDGGLVHRRQVDDVFGTEPRRVRITPGRIEATLTTMRADDPRCCPSGETAYVIRP
jgi:hypothetical protein